MALSGTVFDPSSLSKRSTDPELLRSISERLIDDDVPCAIIAAGCLSNYASFSNPAVNTAAATAGSAPSNESEVMSQITVPLLLRRIALGFVSCTQLGHRWMELINKVSNNEATCAISSSTEAKSSPTEKLAASIEEQWTLQSLCLQTLAELIENYHPLAVSRMSHSDSLVLLLKVIRCAVEYVDKELICANEEKDHPVYEAASNAARVLHSLLDENGELVDEICNSGGAGVSAAEHVDVTKLVNELTFFLSNAKLTKSTILHCCGAILSLRKVLLDSDEQSSSTAMIDPQTRHTLQSCTCTQILPTLHSFFSNTQEVTPKTMVHNMIRLYQDISTQKQDEAMESEITNEINSRKESARSIARRQKEMKAKKVAEAATDAKVNNESVEMNQEKKEGVAMVEDDTANITTTSSDPKDALEPILHSWRETCASHKLALELVANLCSGNQEEDMEEFADNDGMYDEENEHMWDSDDEAKLIEGQAGQSMALKSTNPSDREVYAAIASHHLAEQIFVFFISWILFIPGLGLEAEDKCPDLVLRDVEELLSTCALCLGNVIASDIPTWSSAVTKDIASLVCPDATVENGAALFWCGLVAMLKASELAGNSDAIHHASTVMLALLRHHAIARTLADAPTLDILLNLLSQPLEDKKVNGTKSSVPLQCNTIAILGVLCSETHPAAINDRVCAALAEKLRLVSSQIDSPDDAKRSVLVMNEVYNVLMDMYGGDDANDAVYHRQDVSGHLTRTLPVFKRSIKKVALVERGNEELGVWNETALNVSRFIRFKRDG